MVRKGQVPVPSGVPSHNQGDLPLEEDGRLDSTQMEQVERGVGDEVEIESLRVELQQILRFVIACSSQSMQEIPNTSMTLDKHLQQEIIELHVF